MLAMDGGEEKRGYGWLILTGVVLLAMGVCTYLGIEWWPAMLIIVGAMLVIWGVLAARGTPGFEKRD